MAGTPNMPQGENPVSGSRLPGPAAAPGRVAEIGSPAPLAPYLAEGEWRDEGGGQASKSAFSAAKLLEGFKRRWRPAIFLGLVLGILATVVTWHLFPSKYLAYVFLEVLNDEPKVLSEKQRSNNQQDKTYQNSQAAIAKSRLVLGRAVSETSDLSIVRAVADPVAWLEDEATAAFIENTDILKISVPGDNPTELATLVKAITKAYLRVALDEPKIAKQSALFNLKKIIDQTEYELRQKKEILKKLAETLHTSDKDALDAEQKAVLDEYATLYRMRGSAEHTLRTFKSKLKVTEDELKEVLAGKREPSQEAIDQGVENDYYVKLQAMAAYNAAGSSADTQAHFEPGSPLANRAEQKNDTQQQKLLELKKKTRPIVRGELLLKMKTDLQREIHDGKNRIAAQMEELDQMTAKLSKLQEQAQKLSTSFSLIVLKRSEIDEGEKALRALRAEEQSLWVELQSEKKRITVLQEAEPPDRLVRKRQISAAGVAGFSFFFIGVFGIILLEVRHKRIASANEITQDLGLRVVGVFPSMTNRTRPKRLRKPGSGEGEFWDSVLNESIDSIRTMLLMGGEAETAPPQVIMVTSAMPREGKTTLATQLATSIARTGRRTLLIDFDLRHPMVHQVFDVANSPGLTEAALGETDLGQAIRTTPLVPGLCILPAGDNARRLVPFLSQERVPSLLRMLRSQYDCIIVDSSPVVPVADALLVGQYVDGVVLSIRPHFSQQPSVEAAYERLRATRIRVVGAVVNGVAAPLSPYQYQYLADSIR
jgi:capsular exopolysaccharide synthesis family protein